MSIRKACVVLCAVLLLHPCRAPAGFDIFLQLEDIPGEVTNVPHAGWIAVASFSHGVAQPAGAAGDGSNLVADPLFENAPEGNYRLTPGSPCIDAAADSFGVAVDYDGTPRPLDGNDDGQARFDIGAHEIVHPTADSDGDGLSDAVELAGTAFTPATATDPRRRDSDGDGFGDGEEAVAHTDPWNPQSHPVWKPPGTAIIIR